MIKNKTGNFQFYFLLFINKKVNSIQLKSKSTCKSKG